MWSAALESIINKLILKQPYKVTTLWQWTVSMASVEQQIQTAGLSSRHKNTCNWCICLEMGIRVKLIFCLLSPYPVPSLKRKSCCSIVNTDAILCQYRGSNIGFRFLVTFVLTLVGWIYHSWDDVLTAQLMESYLTLAISVSTPCLRKCTHRLRAVKDLCK